LATVARATNLEEFIVKRVFSTTAAAVFAVLAASPALAANHVIKQKTSTNGTLYISAGLAPGHHYRIDVSSPHHLKYQGAATENYAVIANHTFATGNKSFGFHGTTPDSASLIQPTSRGVTQWLVAVRVVGINGHRMTLRLVDLGRKK